LENDLLYQNLKNGKIKLAAPDSNTAHQVKGNNIEEKENINGIF